jgi:hypothetical protein
MGPFEAGESGGRPWTTATRAIEENEIFGLRVRRAYRKSPILKEIKSLGDIRAKCAVHTDAMNNTSHFFRALRIAGVMGTLSLAAMVAPHASAQVDVHVNLGGPPPPRHEVIVERDRPSPDHVWVGGYWGGSPGHYVWTGGHWEKPARRGAVWVAPRWETHGHDQVFVKGYWR